tara:strand:+ start:64 stop:369 length:306 start_codon:yes stop_codon:yes gene_type:complete
MFANPRTGSIISDTISGKYDPMRPFFDALSLPEGGSGQQLVQVATIPHVTGLKPIAKEFCEESWRYLVEESMRNTCTVPVSLDTQSKEESEEKAILCTLAG